MGLSSKKVCSSGLDWNQGLLEKTQEHLELNPKPPLHLMRKQQQQQQQQSSEAVKCPRCDSTNTKFCYYNNYNKSQPRHFCRACKRHWTKGGTLRNVPVGGGRKKNKRVIKKPVTQTTTTTTSSTSTTTCTNNPLNNSIGNIDAGLNSHMAIQSSLLLQQNLIMESKDFGIGNNGIFLGSTLPPPPLPLPLPRPQNQTFLFPFSTSSSLQSSNVYNYGEELKAMEEPTVNSIMGTQPWEIAATSVGGGGGGGMGIMSNYWGWEDIDSLVSTDLSHNPWDDHNSDIKPL